MVYYVEFTHGDKSKRLIKTTDKAAAIAKAEKAKDKYAKKGKTGIITLYTITTERGFPMRKCFEFWEV